MAFITMWKHDAETCMLFIGGDQILLRLIVATSVIREQTVCLNDVSQLAHRWELEGGYCLA